MSNSSYTPNGSRNLVHHDYAPSSSLFYHHHQQPITLPQVISMPPSKQFSKPSPASSLSSSYSSTHSSISLSCSTSSTTSSSVSTWLVFLDERWTPFDIDNQRKLEQTLTLGGTFVDVTDTNFPHVKRVRVFPKSNYLSYLGVKYRLSRIMQPDAWLDHS